jgi:WD40 repeat protein
LKEHNRTVNRIAWHPANGETLLTGSQDGTMKYWDVRDPNGVVSTFDGRDDAVRDVQFSPFYSNYFAAAFDSGALQIWDIRKTTAFERKITAHRGPCLAIDWHPRDRNWIASGGRDLELHVWDLNAPKEPVRTLGTPSSVARIKWRPLGARQRPHIAVGAAVMENSVQVWDLSAPRMPHRTMYGHTDVVTGLLWHRAKDVFLWTCSKDSTLRCHDVCWFVEVSFFCNLVFLDEESLSTN